MEDLKWKCEPTDKLTQINGQPCRVWILEAPNGARGFAMISRVMVDERADHSAFEAALADMPPPREVGLAEAVDLRLVL